MQIKITGQSVFMEFEHVAKSDRDANKFIKNVTSINRQLTLEANPKPHNARPRRTHHFRWVRGTFSEHNNPQIKAWREANRAYRLSITIERLKAQSAAV